MGRRSINTTKSGKYMNPTDQARKEARKKELKKNKKQRQMVRQAVLKGKDPSQLLEEMEKIDEMEYNVLQPSPLNEKVLKEKRKKLKETLDRVMRLYHTDEPELWAEMKRKEVEYEKRRFKRVQYYDSVRTAEQVQIDDIPLPSSTDKPSVPTTLPKISLPPPILLTNVPPPTLLRKPEESTFDSKSAENKEKQPPGPPPSVPVDLFAMHELDSDYESDGGRDSDSEDDPVPKKSKTMEKEADESDVKGPNTVQQKMLSLSGQNIDDFMKEMENVQKKKEEERALDIKRIDPIPDVEESIEKPEIDIPKPAALIEPVKPKESIPMPQSLPPPVGLPRLPPALMFRPPPMRPSMPQMAIRMPPAPPPRPNMGMGMPRMGIRMPPGPPLGPPPSRHAPKHHHHHHHDRNAMQSAPQISKDPKTATIITAKPQIRNLSADVTRFLPTTLRTKKDETKKPKPRSFIQEQQRQQQLMSHAVKGPTKDDAYAEFMNQMQGFL